MTHPFDPDEDSQILGLEFIPYLSEHLSDLDLYCSDHITILNDEDDLSSPMESTVHVHPLEEDAVSDPESVIVDASEADVFAMDLIPQHADESQVMQEAELLSEELIEEDGEIGGGRWELASGLGLGLRYRANDNHENSRFIVDNCGFSVEGRNTGETSSTASRVDRDSVRVTQVGSDSEDEKDGGNGGLKIELDSDDEYENDEDRSISICWDSLRLEDPRESNEDIEWEEVDEREEVLSVLVDADDEREIPIESMVGSGPLEWEVLLNVRNFDRNLETELDDEDYMYTAEYENLIGQVVESENSLMGRPPASKTVVENLLSVVLTQGDVEKNNALCAICKDDIVVGETAKMLPCAHRYHGDCIVPWLGIRNTCPVCRYELPTDDSDYERRRARRVNHDL